MPSVVPWRFLLTRLSDNLSFYTTFREAVVTGVWSRLSKSGRERYIKGASFHLQYKLNDLDLGTCISCLNSIYHNKLPSYLALNSLVNRCFTLLNTVDLSQTQLLELPSQLIGDSSYKDDEDIVRHLLTGEIIYKLSSLYGILDLNVNVFNNWLNNFDKISDKRHLLLSIFMATNVNIDNVTIMSKYISQLTGEDLECNDKYLLLYIIAKLSHLNNINGIKFDINTFTKYIQDMVELPVDGINDLVKILAIESITMLKEREFNSIDHDNQINKLISVNNSSEFLLQVLLNYNINSFVLWEKFKESYTNNPIPNLALYLLDSYTKYKRKYDYSNKILPLDIANKYLVTIKDGTLSKLTSTSKDDIDLFLQMAKRYRQMIKGRIVKVEPCGLYVEIPTNDKSGFVTGYVDITTFPNTFEERLDCFFIPENHFHVRITNIPSNYDNNIESNTVVVNQVLIKSNDNLISMEPANLDFDVNAVKKRINQQRHNVNKKSKSVTFSKGDMVNATTIVCNNTYEWALFKLQCLKTGIEAKKLGVLDTKNIRGDPIEKLRLLRKIEQGQSFKIKVTGTTGPLYSLNYSKMVQSAT